MSLSLFVDQTPIAEITSELDGPHLRYQEAWRAARGSFPISLSMPLTQPGWPGEAVIPWLMNLLPEGEPLRAMTSWA